MIKEKINEPIIHKGPQIDERPQQGSDPDKTPKKPVLPDNPQKKKTLNG